MRPQKTNFLSSSNSGSVREIVTFFEEPQTSGELPNIGKRVSFYLSHFS